MIYRFAGCVLDEGGAELRRSGVAVEIQPKVFDLLFYLLRHRNRVVTRDELLDAIWPDVTVGDNVLTNALQKARVAVGDSRSAQAIIATVPRRGYRFVAEVDEGHPAASPVEERRQPGSVFVGRETILGQLADAFAATRQGQAHMAVLVGEPGIGKTRTLEQFLLSPPVRTAPVLTGSCDPDDGSPALWPWIQILRNAIELASPGELSSALGPVASDVAHWLPELRERLPGVRGSRDDALRSHEARFRLFDGVANFLAGLAAEKPITLAIEDLQWADPSSLGLLEMIARAGRERRMLVVCTWRGCVTSADDAVGSSLAEVGRHLPLTRIPLPGLSAGEVREWIQRVLDAERPDALTERILQRTEGNPFFVEQILLQLRESSARDRDRAASDDPAVPPGVRDAVHHRLRSVPSECRQMLGVASVF
ncbi:MAG: AAA family ATPase, partial [Proteobacteria bacterium]|nr:AAA family ATPase [Pseudomonadota bacterium]